MSIRAGALGAGLAVISLLTVGCGDRTRTVDLRVDPGPAPSEGNEVPSDPPPVPSVDSGTPTASTPDP
ncbi:MAG: hypothetical protein ACJ8AT_02905, partial [Hyalangium sp.]